jgi:hypothetical protein
MVTDAIAPAGLRQASALAARGKDLVLIGDDRGVLERVSAELRVGHRVDVRILCLDLGAADAADAVLVWLRQCELTIDGLVALRRREPREEYERTVERLAEAFLPRMRSLGVGSVIRVEDEPFEREGVAPSRRSSAPPPRMRRSTVRGFGDPSPPRS